MKIADKIGDVLKETFAAPTKSSRVVDVAGHKVVLRAGGDYRGVDLTGVDLSGAQLEGVNFEGANLKEVNFTGANLRGAKFKHANLARAIISSADFTGVADASEILKAAKYEVPPLGCDSPTDIK